MAENKEACRFTLVAPEHCTNTVSCELNSRKFPYRNKAVLRREFLSLRKTADLVDLRLEDLENYPEFIKAKTVFCYVSAKGEVGTHTLIKELLKEKEVVVPKCIDKEGNMIGVKITSFNELREGFFGILEPENWVEFPKGRIDFAIVPAIAFDEEGYRLGYGKGYYDRFLSDINPYKLGVCAKDFYLPSLPHDELDVKMDSVLVIKACV